MSFWIRSLLITELTSIFHQQGIAYISANIHCQITVTVFRWKKHKEVKQDLPFTLMTVPKLAVNPPLVALGFRTTDPTLKWVWNSGAASTSRHGRRCRDPFLHDWGSWLSNKCRSGVQSRHTGTTHRFPVWLVHLGGQELGLFFSAPSPFEDNEY